MLTMMKRFHVALTNHALDKHGESTVLHMVDRGLWWILELFARRELVRKRSFLEIVKSHCNPCLSFT